MMNRQRGLTCEETPSTGASKSGFSLVEVLVAVSLLGLALMSLAGAAALGLSQMGKARQDLQYAADMQQVTDSLVSLGWNRVTSGTSTVRGRSVKWTVTTLSPTSQKLDVILQRRGLANTATVYSDTVTVYLASNQVQ
jgi:prepilin-type N-terminal cleavage/methylation domain-containing protein